jgi:hypothetical protein
MTTLLFTPELIVVDSRSTSYRGGTGEAIDGSIKLHKFGSSDADALSLSEDTDEVLLLATGAGNVNGIQRFLRSLSENGLEKTLELFRHAKDILPTHHVPRSFVVVGVSNHRYHIFDYDNHVLTHRKRSFTETFAHGSGGKVALALHTLCGVKPAIAVLATSLIDDSTGGNTICVKLNPDADGKVSTSGWVWNTLISRRPETVRQILEEELQKYDWASHVVKFPHTPKEEEPLQKHRVRETLTPKGREEAKTKQATVPKLRTPTEAVKPAKKKRTVAKRTKRK